MKMDELSIQLKKSRINDIPFICCTNGEPGKKKLVVLYHSYLDSKEFMLNFAYRLAEMGFLAVAVDLDRHGERDNYVVGKFPWKEFYNTVFKTAQEITTVINYFVEKEEVENGNITVLGTSMGGLTAFAASIVDERVNNIASIMASANYPQLARVKETSTLRRFFSDNIYCKDEFIKNVEKKSEIFDPYYNISMMPPKRIFMINGTVDMAIPIKIVEDFQEKLISEYKDKRSNLKFISIPGGGHLLSREMYEETLIWVKGLLD